MSSPPPPNPTTTTTAVAATATADFFKSVARQRPRKHVHPSIYQTFYNPQPATSAAFPPPTQRQQPPQQSLQSNSRTHHQQSAAGGVLYPVASSGRGFLSKHQQLTSDQSAAVGVVINSDGFPPGPVSAYPYAVHRPYGFSNSDIPGQTSHQLVTPSSAHLQQTLMGGGAIVPTFAAGVSVSANPKVVAQSSAPEDNGLYTIRDKNGDGSFAIIRDRKVQVVEGTSLYAQCRSWLKNGFTLENQPQYVDCVKSLPKPLPASMVEATKEDDMEMEEKMEDVEHLSAKELLQQHVKHAKKVRVRLRNQRLQRIERACLVAKSEGIGVLKLVAKPMELYSKRLF
ncbi:unnamed protein product [Lactuca virosa]|uniref:Uncharacterized protein n=1 Tax=Lactuca virosa TaxID=75947 RepID=A0AAU9M7C9_9ASTR|nr:unnamed protein product [Lactuca virosa]